MGEVLLGNLANFIFWENLTVILVWKCSINYASRNRVKTLTLNTDLTTFCKLTAFFLIFILFYFFMVPLLLLSLVQMSLKQWGSWDREVGRVDGFFPPQLSLISAFVQGKEQKIHSCARILQQKPCSRSELAGTKWLRRMGWGGIVPKGSAVLGRTGCCPALCDQSPALRAWCVVVFYEAKSVQNL